MKDIVQERLEVASLSCGDPIQKALIEAELAYHYARAGDFRGAGDLLRKIRALPRAHYAPSVAIWVMLSEGILEFFENLDPHAHDRFRRAYALSVSIGDLELQALTSAWLAHVEFNQRNYAAMVSSARSCLAIYPHGRTTAHARIFMVLANSNLYAGNVSLASGYFERARSIALTDGDRTTVGAIVYNRAALMLNNFRLQPFLDVGESIDLGLVSVAVESATAFQDITRNRSLSELPLMSEARLAMLKGDFASALNTIGRIRDSEHRHRGGAKDPLLDIEYVACLARTGELGRARKIIGEMDLSRYTELDNDDQIVFFSQLTDIRVHIDCDFHIGEPDVLMGAAIERFSDELTNLRDAVSSLTRSFGDLN
jgi:hypothetical protein